MPGGRCPIKPGESMFVETFLESPEHIVQNIYIFIIVESV